MGRVLSFGFLLTPMLWLTRTQVFAAVFDLNIPLTAIEGEEVLVPFVFYRVTCSPRHLFWETPDADCDIDADPAGRCRLLEYTFDDFPHPEVRGQKSDFPPASTICAFLVRNARASDAGFFSVCRISSGVCNNWHKRSLTVESLSTETIFEVSMTTPEVSLATSEVSMTTPEVSLTTTQVSLTTSDVSMTTSGVFLETSEVSMTTPEVSLATSEVSITTPEVSLTTSQVSLTISDVSMTTSGVSLATSEVSMSTSEVSMTTSEVSVTSSTTTVDKLATTEVTGVSEILEPTHLVFAKQLVNDIPKLGAVKLGAIIVLVCLFLWLVIIVASIVKRSYNRITPIGAPVQENGNGKRSEKRTNVPSAGAIEVLDIV
ncbi:uncharacterized protein [Diadema antillarum]|uniref:uncharacterized protein n=1 Tax=Diadema antillarum TaxID=105358 RepID=UPI003A8C4D93